MSPNAITLETEAKAEGIFEMRTFTFFPAGVTVKIDFYVFLVFSYIFSGVCGCQQAGDLVSDGELCRDERHDGEGR